MTVGKMGGGIAMTPPSPHPENRLYTLPMNAPASMADRVLRTASKAAGVGVCAFTTPKTTTKTTG